MVLIREYFFCTCLCYFGAVLSSSLIFLWSLIFISVPGLSSGLLNFHVVFPLEFTQTKVHYVKDVLLELVIFDGIRFARFVTVGC